MTIKYIKKSFFNYFPLFKINRKIFEKELRNFSKKIKNGKNVLDFASAGNKYAYLFENCNYDGADILDKDLIEKRDNRKLKLFG